LLLLLLLLVLLWTRIASSSCIECWLFGFIFGFCKVRIFCMSVLLLSFNGLIRILFTDSSLGSFCFAMAPSR
jgi:hypothetical protein